LTRTGGQGLSVAIIGAGFGGIATACYLKRAGFTDFTVFERSPGPGGTWWDNTYPGAACDVESHLYSLSFRLANWSQWHASQVEIQQYLAKVIHDEEVEQNFRFRTGIQSATWDSRSDMWDLVTDAGESLSFRFLVSAVGMLNNPNVPDFPGLETFAGPRFHSARWEHQHDLRDRTIGVVGTGSTAAQLVPALLQEAGRVVLFQREAAWVVPKPTGSIPEPQHRRLRRQSSRRLRRLKVFLDNEKRIGTVTVGSRRHRKTEEALRTYLDDSIADPALRETMRPSYPFRCKRPIRSSDFYPALNNPRFELVPSAVASVTSAGVVDASGKEHPLDVLVMATGFQAANILGTLHVVGAQGESLQEAWRGEPEALLGITYPEFPNFFMLYGPNTNPSTTSVVVHLECQAKVVVRALRAIKRSGASRVETRPAVLRRYYTWMIPRLQASSYNESCHNYFRSASGRVVTNWPCTSTLYYILTHLPLRIGLRFESGSRVGGAPDDHVAEPSTDAAPSLAEEPST
jgi:cation diffusion facilitator CzcD-associated flavoprotein CzcO